ncbi:hypothetical protein [Aliiroseovarius lamellibrachiae]|uniref:hypothetical protein n=1 Tax=Aliiroseovarius lamellibrachiae TaxID=1924933 RepID=UPI001BDFC9B7|nr:hypothetical protein [Aliiroseovarius lamellibrachiae]MBT2131790.1 hypothetical protein [Aliiroseovarius lamellibrachiae]
MDDHRLHKKLLRIYLSDNRLEQVRAGGFHVVARIRETLEARGFRVELRRNSDEERLKSVARAGYALFLMDAPLHDRALTLRKSYFFPFWRLEKSDKRWEFDVALKSFDPAEIDPDMAEKWAGRWQGYLFGRASKPPPQNRPIYIALQGRLLAHRSFQSMSPMEMIEATISAYPDMPIIIGLHPNETYTKAELAALDTVSTENPQLIVQTGGMEDALRACRFVVTQNSSAALMGYFFHKPAVLFGKIDFHHIGLNVYDLGVAEVLRMAPDHAPAFDQYLYWFTMHNAIKADAEDVHDQIAKRLTEHGWRLE